MDRGIDSRSESEGSTNFRESLDQPDRREGDRYRSVCRIARVSRSDDMGLWRVRNISDKGMMLAADVELAGGEAVEIALSESTVINGRIVWAEKGRCGIAFDQPIDAAAVLATLAQEQQAEGYRALRLPIEIEALVLLRNDARPIDLVDISQSGAGFVYDSKLDPGTEIDLLLPGDDQKRPALVRWSKGNRGGLWFRRPLDRTELESVARFRS